MTVRQIIVKEVVRQIDKWNFPLFGKDDYFINMEIDGEIVKVKYNPISHNDPSAIWSQVEEWQLSKGTDDTKEYIHNLSTKAENRLINEIGRKLRYRFER